MYDYYDVIRYTDLRYNVIEDKPFVHSPGFVRLKERHRVKAQRTIVNAIDRRCRITKIKLK